MTIQFKRGLKRDLPNPLPIAEFGYCTDTDEIYRGNGVVNENELVWAAPIVVATTYYVATTALGGRAESTGATGESLGASTATGTTVNRLIDSSFPGGFSSAKHLNKSVYNVTNGAWAKIMAVNSTSNCTISADIMVSGDSYVICDALDNVQEAYSKIPVPYYANFSVRCSPGVIAGDATLVGKTAGGNFTVTIQGDNAGGYGGTKFSGVIAVYDRVTLAGGSNYKLTFTNRVNVRGTANVTWSYCQTTGSSGKVFKYDNAANTFSNSIITFGNDPGTYTETSSTITKGYYGLVNATDGSDTNAENFAVHSGSATSTTANKLVDSAANFGTDVVDMVLWNSTDDTWTTVTARDSATQLSLAANIMASGEAYQLGDAFATIQKGIDSVPGTVNAYTTVKANNATFNEMVTVMGKAFSGSYSLTLEGTMSIQDTVANADIFSANTIGLTTKGWTVNAYTDMIVRTTGGTGSGQERVIKSNTATTLTVHGRWETTPDATTDFIIENWLTIIDGGATRNNCVKVTAGQKGVRIAKIKGQNTTTSETSDAGNFVVDTGGDMQLWSVWSLTAVRAIAALGGTISRAEGVIAEKVYGTFAQPVVIGDGSIGEFYSPLIRRNTNVATGGAFATRASTLKIWYGCTIDGAGTASNGTVGLSADRNAVVQLINCAATDTEIKNWDTAVTGNGVKAATGGQVFRSAGVITFSGNTTDENAVAASYGYIGT